MEDIRGIKELELLNSFTTKEGVKKYETVNTIIEGTIDLFRNDLKLHNDNNIFDKLYKFLGYGYEENKEIINLNDILFYLCCPLYQKSFSDFMQWEQGDFLQSMYSPNKYGIQNITLTGTNDTYAAFAGLCSICSPTLFEKAIPGEKKSFKTATQLGKTPTVMFSCALERNTKYPTWLYITYHKAYKKDNEIKYGIGSVPLSDPLYNKDGYYRKHNVETRKQWFENPTTATDWTVVDKISYKGEGVIYKEEDGKYYYNLSCVSRKVLNLIKEILLTDDDFEAGKLARFREDFLIVNKADEIISDENLTENGWNDPEIVEDFINIKLINNEWKMYEPDKDYKIVGVSNRFVEKYFSNIDEDATKWSEEIILEDEFGIIIEKVAY